MPLPIALELYTIRDETARDMRNALRRVAEIGYRAVEFAGYGGLAAGEMRAVLAETGLEAAATHVSLDALRRDLEGEIGYCRTIGCRYLIVPSVPAEYRDDLVAAAGELMALGRACRDADIIFGYHNHDAEFRAADGEYPLDRLLDATAAELLVLELDVYWAAHAGVDPLAYLQRHAGRIPILHLKDMTPERTFTEVGAGTLPLRELVERAPDLHVQWGIVENDEPAIPSLESAARSLHAIAAWTQ